MVAGAGARTASVKVVVLERGVPVTAIVGGVPVRVAFALAESVMVYVPAGLTAEVGLILAVTPLGSPETAMVTPCAVPVVSALVTVTVVEPPCLTVALPELERK